MAAVVSFPGSISIVIPCYNEAPLIESTVRTIHGYFRRHGAAFEIIAINDGSTDQTMDILGRIRDELDGVVVLDNMQNRGKGYSVRKGIERAGGDFIIFTDADLSTPIEEAESFLTCIEDFDIVIASRKARGARVVVHQPLYRERMGEMYNLLLKAVLMRGIDDTQCGFKLFSRKAGKDIFKRVTFDGFGFDAEALYLARKLGYKVKEAPVRWFHNPETKVRPIRDSIRMLVELFLIRVRHREV